MSERFLFRNGLLWSLPASLTYGLENGCLQSLILYHSYLKSWYIASSSHWGMTFVIRMENNLLNCFPYPLSFTNTFIPYKHHQKTLRSPPYYFFHKMHPFSCQLLPMSLCLSSFWWLSFDVKFSRMYSFIWICWIKRHHFKFTV